MCIGKQKYMSIYYQSYAIQQGEFPRLTDRKTTVGVRGTPAAEKMAAAPSCCLNQREHQWWRGWPSS